MAVYTQIDNPELYFQTKLYAGTGSALSITLDGSENMQPDWVWIKERNASSSSHNLTDSVRGAGKGLFSNDNSAEYDYGTGSSGSVRSFDSNGFTLGTASQVNPSGVNMVSWNWSAGGSAPAITYTVKVVSDGGNKYRFDDFGTSAVTLDLQEGGTYTFDLSDSSNDGHPMKFSTTSNGSHGGGSTYSTGIVYQLDGASVTEANYYNTSNFNSASSRKIIITVSASAPTLYYFCHYHSGMGGQANTNSTFGSSNFSGSLKSTVSANTTAGFSIVAFTGDGTSGATLGHGINGFTPKVIIVKSRDIGINSWAVGHNSLGFTDYIYLNKTDATVSTAGFWNNTAPTSSVFTLGNNDTTNGSGDYIAYCFAEKKGYSKFGSYTGNGNADGTFVYTGFKPALVIMKETTDSATNWVTYDNKRNTSNPVNLNLYPNLSNAEGDASLDYDFLSNGFKVRTSNGGINASGQNYIYMAFAESPFVNSNGVPTTAR